MSIFHLKNFILSFVILSSSLFAENQTLKLRHWKVGDKIKTPEGMSLRVLKRIDDGHKGVVYQVQDKLGAKFALKVPINDDKSILDSFVREPQKSPDLDAVGADYAKILEFGKNYMLKEWVEGIRGDVWLKKWEKNGSDTSDEVYHALLETFQDLAQKGVYIGNLKPLNVIFDGDTWIIVDPGSVDQKLPKKEALQKYHDLLTSRWKFPTDKADPIFEKRQFPIYTPSEEETQITEGKMKRSKMYDGKSIKTPGGMELKVIKYVDNGKRGMVWKAEDKAGKQYAIKIAKIDDKETYESIQNEPEKEKSVVELGVPVAHIVEGGKNYVIKDWLSGIRGDVWLRKWVKKGANPKDPAFKKLLSFFDSLAKKGVFVGDLNRKNMMYDGEKWLVVESGKAHPEQDPKELKIKYRAMFAETWTKYTKCPQLLELVGLE